MAMTSMSVIFSVFVLHIHHRGNLHRRAPSWLRKTALVLSKVVCHRPSPLLSQSKQEFLRKQQQQQRSIKMSMRTGYGSFNQGFKLSPLRNVTLRTMENGEYSIQPSNNGESHCHDVKHNGRVAPSLEEELLAQLQVIVKRYEKEDSEIRVNSEWEDIAIVFDRVLFVFMCSMATTVTLSLLIFKPLTKSVSIDDFV